jgi:two-component system phosphate regulon sensor histidine kinase PhoR
LKTDKKIQQKKISYEEAKLESVISELKLLEQVRQDFVANVSHELRTPLSNIKGYAETLLDGALDDKKNAKDFLNIIYKESDRLSKLIDDLLDLSKIESGKMKMVIKPLELRPIAVRVIDILKKFATDKSINISVSIPEDLPRLLGDENRITQALINLVDNAIKYTAASGAVKISASKQDGFVKIDVTDTGMGIPKKDIPRIFERFYRVDKARSRELGGTGLGLSIVKHIAQSHGGDVLVISTLGKGSTFSFTIPAA